MDEGIFKVIKQLQERQRELLAKAEKIGATITSLKEVFGDQLVLSEMLLPAPAPPATSQAPAGEYAGMTIGEAGIAYLRKGGTPRKTRIIADALEAAGLHSTDMYRALYTALSNREEDVRLNRHKQWELLEWSQE